jgi:hypothetical protein
MPNCLVAPAHGKFSFRRTQQNSASILFDARFHLEVLIEARHGDAGGLPPSSQISLTLVRRKF